MLKTQFFPEINDFLESDLQNDQNGLVLKILKHKDVRKTTENKFLNMKFIKSTSNFVLEHKNEEK